MQAALCSSRVERSRPVLPDREARQRPHRLPSPALPPAPLNFGKTQFLPRKILVTQMEQGRGHAATFQKTKVTDHKSLICINLNVVRDGPTASPAALAVSHPSFLDVRFS